MSLYLGIALAVLGALWQVASFAINLRRDVDELKAHDVYEHGSYRLPGEK